MLPTPKRLASNAILSVISLVFAASAAAAQDEQANFRGEGEGEWYHPLELEEWAELGADPKVLDRLIERIGASTGPRFYEDMPDTQIAYEAGNWVYEWTQAGDAALAHARGADTRESALVSAKAAIAYYHFASSPHTNDPLNRAALDLSGQAYNVAAKLLEHDIREVTIEHKGTPFQAYVHLPRGKGPFPVVVISNGSDQAKEMLLSYFLEYLDDQNIAMISLDLPGMGDSNAFDIRDGDTSKLHLAAVDWVKTQDAFDENNIFIQGGSFGGHAAAQAFLKSADYDLAGVITECPVLDKTASFPPEVYGMLPPFSVDGVRTRLGLEPGSSLDDFADLFRVIQLEGQGLYDTDPIDTPLLAISTTDDPVADLEDLDKLLSFATQSQRIVLQEEGHCPDSISVDLVTTDWIVNNLR